MQNILVIGAGRVGLSTAAVIALHHPSLRVVLVDKSEERINELRKDHFVQPHASNFVSSMPGLRYVLPIVINGADNANIVTRSQTPKIMIEGSVHSPNMGFGICPPDNADTETKNGYDEVVRNADMVIIATDSDNVRGVVSNIGRELKSNAIIVIKSSLTPLQMKGLTRFVKEMRSQSKIEVIANPEFLSQASVIYDQLVPDRVIIGAGNDASGKIASQKLAMIYSAWVPRERILVTDTKTAQLIKMCSNTLLAQRVSTCNAINDLCQREEANAEDLLLGVGADRRIGGSYLQPGPGYGGTCLPISIAHIVNLSTTSNVPDVAAFLNGIGEFNEQRAHKIGTAVAKLLTLTPKEKPLTLAVLGYAYKSGVADHRASIVPSVLSSLTEQLQARRRHLDTVKIFDPLCDRNEIIEELKSVTGITQKLACNTPLDACSQANVVLVINDHSSLINHRSDGLDQKEIDIIRLLARSELRAKGIHLDQRAPDTALDEWVIDRVRSSERRIDPGHIVQIPEFASRATKLMAIGIMPSGRPAYTGIDWLQVANFMEEPKAVLDCIGVGEGSKKLAEARALGLRVENLGRIKE